MKNAVKIFTICTLAGMSIVYSRAHAAAGEHTISQGYAHFHAPGLKKFVRDASDYNRISLEDFVHKNLTPPEYDQTVFRGYPGKDKAPQGINVRYRYEITDSFGVITSFTWARAKTDSKFRAGINETHGGEDVKGKASAQMDVLANYRSVLAGPAWRLNQYASLYVMAGAGISKVTADLKVKGSVKRNQQEDKGGFSESYSQRKKSFAWSAGTQFNLNDSVAMDLAYEGSGSGDWRTSGFVVGVGLRF